ncbi:MAG: type II toxin-antitoxin system HicB family antitoxin [Proteobacteria bacterium]|nr:type II toxin-antitoxin system HicB family antitoxin [Pseudomonadota bacterium]
MVVLEREPDGSYSIYVPDLPGCASQGETYDETIANIREAIALYLDGLRDDGLEPPEPRTHVTTVQVAAA